MQRWEYMFFDGTNPPNSAKKNLSIEDRRAWESSELNRLGSQGWEVVTFVDIHQQYLLKRQK